jgi:hypothetical protein
MRGFTKASTVGRRLLLSGLILYLFGVIGILAPTHRHDNVSQNASHSQQHPDCQLCQVSSEAYLAPVASICTDVPLSYVCLAEQRHAPLLASRHQPFSSRGPPSA